MSAGAPEVFPIKSVSGWADASDNQQCVIYGIGVPNEFNTMQENFEITCPVSTPPARSLLHSLPHPSH